MAVDYIRQYDVMPFDICDQLISAFEGAGGLVHRDAGPMDFYELNINEHHPEAVRGLSRVLQRAFKQYQEDIPFAQYLPPFRSLEQFRVKRYTGGTSQQFAAHVDIGDAASCRRALAFLFYLNDGFAGGETVFYGQEFTITQPDRTIYPRKGSVVVFPPTWQYPHAGLPVTSGTKYIMSSYLSYDSIS